MQQITTVLVEFYRGIKSIANFLNLTPDKARKLISEGEDPCQEG